MQISYLVKDQDELAKLYMSYIKGSGIFIPTTTNYQLGDQVQIDLALFTSDQTLSFTGKVVLINPEGAQHNLMAGIGVQFLEPSADEMRKKIEANLPMTKRDQLTGILG